MLERIQSEVGKIGSLGVTIDSYHPALFVEAIKHLVYPIVRHNASYFRLSAFSY
jgi:hypothetical protein